MLGNLRTNREPVILPSSRSKIKKKILSSVTNQHSVILPSMLLVWVREWFVVIFGIITTSGISKLFYIISRALRRVKFGAILNYHDWHLCQISHTIHAITCLYYNLRNSVIKHHLFIFVELFRFLGEQIGLEVLVFGPAAPDIEPGRCTFLSILVFRIFF